MITCLNKQCIFVSYKQREIMTTLTTNMRKAKANDFKIGLALYDVEGNRFVLRRKYDEGVWECNRRVHFENEAKFYTINK